MSDFPLVLKSTISSFIIKSASPYIEPLSNLGLQYIVLFLLINTKLL